MVFQSLDAVGMSEQMTLTLVIQPTVYGQLLRVLQAVLQAH
jgi:hypothetical protein